MSLGIIVITNKTTLPEVFLRRLNFADKVLFVYETKKPSLEVNLNNVDFLQTGLEANFSKKRNAGLKRIKTDWVLFVDDDEIISNQLAKEIKDKINDKSFSGYYLTRYDLCFYQELKHGEIKNQKILRLARGGKGVFSRSVHEVWSINGNLGYLDNILYHQKDYFISQFIARIRQYAPQDVDSLNKENKHYSLFKLLFYPILKFLYNYFVKLGYKDGLPGLFLAYLMSVQSLSVRLYQWEKTLK
ncbi:hypothetical protein A2572_02775 [Candidatus Collierbacteria bacterium RIFOXYD1_FULL_40_9]|uniref:Glycosyltransferase 2-like domain-containing protein n=1 Tax=Candidatus Collierbacteria bacterium RIFOXYD1_FULL_40_9 TaxID=1817731 RepID=A0A1F5FUB9_9BACT|nr:MAG: hypothetical protein A2572_02775 [Candidatus Collierbacteria bacterium RIFOXYD1_FULL_40_9]